MEKLKLKKYSDRTKKFLLYMYLIFFIFLNIADFFNALSSDLDFFKKLLSWSLIGYIFYKVSFTKVLIGTRLKRYDGAIIFAYCLMTIPRSLFLYLQSVNISDFSVFGFVIKYIIATKENISPLLLLNSFMIIGALLVFIVAVNLLSNYQFKKKSLIGSFSYERNKYIENLIRFIVMFIVVLFFGIIVFSLFMEWFALAVDALILIIGLLYYFAVFIHNHTVGKTSNLLKKISNSGNSFYQNLIESFSDKKTFFYGVGFLLVLHTMVDFGVFMVPYLIGTENGLYFDKLGSMHDPIIDIFSYSANDAWLYNDISKVSSDFLLVFSAITIYLCSIITAIMVMVYPFYIYYHNIKKQKVKVMKFVIIAFIVSFSMFLIINLGFNNLKSPITFGNPTADYQVQGVDITTNSIYVVDGGSIVNHTSSALLINLIILLFIAIAITYRYEKYNYFFEKFTYAMILICFLVYIISFALNSTEKDQEETLNLIKDASMKEYEERYSLINQSSSYKEQVGKSGYDYVNFDLTVFSENMYDNYRYDYLLIELTNIDTSKTILVVDNSTNVYSNYYRDINNNYYSGQNKIIYFNKEEVNLIIDLGVNNLTMKNGRYTKESLEKSFSNLFTFDQAEKVINNKKREILVNDVSETIRYLFASAFYLFGILFFTYFYVKNNFFNNRKYV